MNTFLIVKLWQSYQKIGLPTCKTVYMKKITFIIVLLSFALNSVFSQNIMVRGVVLNGSDNEPLPGVSVVLKENTNIGTITDINGKFSLSTPPNAILTISYIGFKSQQIQIKGQDLLKIMLEENNKLLDEVVVVGYGVQKKANLTGAVASMKNEELLKSKAANSTTALVGQVSGIIAKQANGEPGADNASLFIRGIATFTGGTQPAFIIDGVERTSSDFARMDPNEIESINVMKDAASAAVFGMRGANGVIVITTKRGKKEKTNIKYSMNVSIQSPTKLPQFANSYDYARLYNTFMGQEVYTQDQLQKFKDGSDPENYPNTNWYKEMLTKNAIQHQHNLSITGGTEKTQYFVSAGFLDQGGLWKDINYKRYNLRSNLDAEITKTTHLGIDISGRVENTLNSGAAEGIFASLVRYTPIALCRYSDGTFANPDKFNYNFVAANQPGGSYNKGNIFVVDARVDLEQKLNFITSGLSIKGTASYAKYINSYKSWNVSPYTYTKDTNGDYVLYPRGAASLGLSGSGNNQEEYQLQINYNRSFGNHNVTAMAMSLVREGYYDGYSLNRKNYNVEILDQMGSGAPDSEDQSISGYDSRTARASYIGRINYNYLQRYLFEINARRDGSENFAPDKRWGTFMSGSLGWVISEEKFFGNIKKIINSLKLRASYGTLGNDNTGGISYPYYSRYDLYTAGTDTRNYFPFNMGDYTFGTTLTQGILPGAVANTSATWEKSTKTNIGIDASVCNKLNLTIDIFKEYRSAILLQRYDEIPASFGGTLPMENIGKVMNKGIDLSLNYHQKIGQINYSLGGNFTFARNEIIYMAEASGTSKYMNKTGRPIGGYYGYKTDGIFKTQTEIDTYAKQEVAGSNYVTKPGDIKYVDVDGNGVVNSNDMTYLGNGNIPEIIYGINGTLKWKNLDLSFLFQGAGRVQVYLKGGVIQPYYNGGNLPQFWVNESWSEENINARYPRLSNSTHNNPTESIGGVQTYLYDASYLRLKNIEIGYSILPNLMQSIGIENLRLYANAQNILTFSKVPQIDPENTQQSGWTYPQMKAFNIGLTLQF